MTDKGDTRSARWARTVAKWRKWRAEMVEQGGYEITEPPNQDTPPHKRGTQN